MLHSNNNLQDVEFVQMKINDVIQFKIEPDNR